jgi:glutathione S-transferase
VSNRYLLHIANKNYSSWSLRPWLLLSELGIPFEDCMTPFAEEPSSNRTAFAVFSPSGKVPCLHDGDMVVWDSLAIIEYVAESHPGVWPADAPARAWARCASAEMHAGFSALRTQCPMNCGIRLRLHEMPADLQRDLQRIDELWRDGLGHFGGPFLAGGHFGAVDAFYAPVAFRMQSYGLELGNIAMTYAQRLRDLPSMRRWYAEALAETWRDRAHDAAILRSGELIEDSRAT